MVTLQFCSFLQKIIQKPQKEHPLKAYAKASLKSHEGKEREKRAKENQLSPGPANFLLFGITNEHKNKFLELIISSHGQYTQREPPAKVLVICDTSENSSSRRWASLKGQDWILLLFRVKPHWNEAVNWQIKPWGFGAGFQRLAGAGRSLWEILHLQHTERWKGLWPQVNYKQTYTSAAFYVSPFKLHNCFKRPLGCTLGSNLGHYAQIVNQMPQPCYS